MESQNENVKLTVNDNFLYLQNILGNGIDLIESRFEVLQNCIPIGVVYIESMTDKELVRTHIVEPLLKYDKLLRLNPAGILQFMQMRIITAPKTTQTNDMTQVLKNILSGNTVLFLENCEAAMIIGSRKVEKKAIASPENESTIFGSQESFTDDVEVNSSLIIKRLPVPNLHFEEYTVGTLTRTKLKLIWLEGVINPDIITEARNRIEKIDIDRVDGIGTLGELIEDKPVSIFPKYRQTERPDVAAKNLTDGRFIIILSNAPFAFIAPAMFWDNFKTIDDYHERPMVSSYLRIVRYLSFFLTTSISALYLSFVTYNQAIVPPTLALSIAVGREGAPLPSVLELLLLSLAITIIREAGLRMHGSVGYFVGSLAAVVIGQAVVTAGYVSPSLIIVVAVSTISAFAITSTTLLYPSRLINYFFILLAGSFGIFGLINGVIIILWHLCSLKSFTVPYLHPIIPFDKEGIKDSLIRAPLKNLKKRMKVLSPFNTVRASDKGIK